MEIFELAKFINKNTLAMVSGGDDIIVCNNFIDLKQFIDYDYHSKYTIRLFNKDRIHNFDEYCYEHGIKDILYYMNEHSKDDSIVFKTHFSLLKYYDYDQYSYYPDKGKLVEEGMFLNTESYTYNALYFSIPSLYCRSGLYICTSRGDMFKLDDEDTVYYVLHRTTDIFMEYNCFEMEISDYRAFDVIGFNSKEKKFVYKESGEADSIHMWTIRNSWPEACLTDDERKIKEYLDTLDFEYFVPVHGALEKLEKKFFNK